MDWHVPSRCHHLGRGRWTGSEARRRFCAFGEAGIVHLAGGGITPHLDHWGVVAHVQCEAPKFRTSAPRADVVTVDKSLWPFCPPRLEVTLRRLVMKPLRLTTFSNADKMCSCASLVDPLCWGQVCEWSPSVSSTKQPQLHRRCGPVRERIAMPRNRQNHVVHQSKGNVMTVSCCSDKRQVINAGGAQFKCFSLAASASSLSGMSSPRMEVGSATLAGMRCIW